MTIRTHTICTYDPLKELVEYYADASKAKKETIDIASLGVEERLRQRIIDGEKVGLENDLSEALKRYSPIEIINSILLDGMKTVGELFGSGEMQLPFVLQSAETMKTAVAFLEPMMEKIEGLQKGTIVLATVKGDVHDIGKNLVDIILTNNGYKVINLGIKCPVETMLHAAEEQAADAIGMSGLLVKSTLIMKENLEVMNQRGMMVPVVLGGAALTRRFVEGDLRSIYQGEVAYANDAFDGLKFMEAINTRRSSPQKLQPEFSKESFLSEAHEEQQRFLATLARIDDRDFVEQETLSKWSVHDTVSHIIGWHFVARGRLEKILEQKYDEIRWCEDDEEDAWNETFVRRWKYASRGELIAKFNSSLQEVLALFQQIGEHEYNNDAHRFPLSFWLPDCTNVHHAKHRKRIEDWLSKKDGSGIEAKVIERRELTKTISALRSAILPDPSPPKPPFYGSKIVTDVRIEKVFEYLNLVALIRGQWQVRKGKKSDGDYQKMLSEEIYPKLEEMKLLMKRERLLTPKVVYGYFPCSASGDDLIVYRPRAWKDDSLCDAWEIAPVSMDDLIEWQRFRFPRQQGDRHLCISDYFLPKESGKFDTIAFQIVTVGERASEYAAELFTSNRYQEYLYVHGLSVESAEALAEYWHKMIRVELGIASDDAPEITRLFSQGYRGSRFSFGYPACPNIEDQRQLFELLSPERIGITLTEEFQLVPEQSTSALIVHHAEAKYFLVK